MKTMMLMAVIALVAITGYSEDNKESKEPAELTAAKADYAAQIEKVTAPIKAKQITRLEKLKTQLTKKGDLEGALAVQDEIDALANDDESLLLGKWEMKLDMGYTSIWTFKKDGTVLSTNGIKSGRWTLGKKGVTLAWDNSDAKDLMVAPLKKGGTVISTVHGPGSAVKK